MNYGNATIKCPKVLFYPYIQSKCAQNYDQILTKTQCFIDYFPGLNQDWSRRIQKHGVKWLAYISLYKTPILSEVEYGTGFRGGAQTREELEVNPYWESVAIAVGKNIHAAQDETSHPRKPFNNDDYKKGWYQLCILQAKRNILEGIGKIASLGVNGFFIDNVIQPAPCYKRECFLYNYQVEYELLMTKIIEKIRENKGTVILNVGRKYLFSNKFDADIYCVENFIYGRSQDESKLYFAGKYTNEKLLTKETSQLNEIHIDSEVLGYTKTPVHLPLEKRKEMLNYAQDLSKRCGMSWTTTLVETSLLPL